MPESPFADDENRKKLMTVLATGLSLMLLAGTAVVGYVAFDQFRSFGCYARLAPAKAAMRQLHAMQQAHHDEHGVYAASVDELGWQTPHDKGLRFVVSMSQDTPQSFHASAAGTDDLQGDLWTVTHDGVVLHPKDVCLR